MASSVRSNLTLTGQPMAIKRTAKTISGAGTTRLAAQRNALGDIGNSSDGSGIFKRPALPLNKKNITHKADPTLKKSIMTKSTAPTASRSANACLSKQVQKVEDEVAAMDISSSSNNSSQMVVDETQHNAFSRHLIPQIDDVDLPDQDNPQLVAFYVNDIMQYMREVESEQSIRPSYLCQTHLHGKMRAVLVDWMVEVHSQFHLLQETLFLSVALLDRFLQEHQVPREKLQLAGISAMYLASKYEEMYSPDISDFVYIADNAYSKQEIREMEMLILRKINFSLGRPLPLHFLRRYSKVGSVNPTQHAIAKYLMELALPEYSLCHVSPSMIAAASLCVAVNIHHEKTVKPSPALWTQTLIHYSTYTYEQLLPVVKKLAVLGSNASKGKLQAVFKKHSLRKFQKIAQHSSFACYEIQQLAGSPAV